VRRFLVILCLLLNVSVTLMPFDTAHAHISPAHTLRADIHSGHSHDLDLDASHDDHEKGAQIVDFRTSASTQNPFQSTFWSDWMPLLCLVALTVLVAQLCTAAFSPPSSDPKPASRHGYWRPPLRGPPAYSIR
jgi:predicted RNA-binding Zn ribbon-like protein